MAGVSDMPSVPIVAALHVVALFVDAKHSFRFAWSTSPFPPANVVWLIAALCGFLQGLCSSIPHPWYIKEASLRCKALLKLSPLGWTRIARF